jgi:hypothetical protein
MFTILLISAGSALSSKIRSLCGLINCPVVRLMNFISLLSV